jgi:hypothetical protein
MSVDNQFTATGPAIVGFQTNGANIQRGAEVAGTVLGVRGIGPTGVAGVGQNGPGGRFASSGAPPGPPQIRIDPHESTHDPGKPVKANPMEFGRPEDVLPDLGHIGDLWFSFFPKQRSDPHPAVIAGLWLCVRPSELSQEDANFEPAVWCQVLLGAPVKGAQKVPVPFD